MTMYLYLLYWDGYDYDQYSHALVVANSEDDARHIHPHGQDEWTTTSSYRTWCKTPDDVTSVTYIGEAAPNLKEGDVVVTSFHAG